MKHLISFDDLTRQEIEKIFELTKEIKKKQLNHEYYMPLKGKTLGMIFEKASTRTRVSFEVGMFQLGGHALFLSSSDLQLKRGETISDTAKTLSRYLDGIMMRTYNHQDVVNMSRYATIPVINGLTDLLHPCQVLSDIYTILEKKQHLKKVKIVYIGDGDNVANSLAEGAGKLGLNIVLCTPKSYQPNKDILKKALRSAGVTGARIVLSDNPREAIKNADIVYTDVWISMGKEAEEKKRLRIFRPYQINAKLLKEAKKDVMIMHCLPAYRGDEITSEVMDSEKFIGFDQAENRLHVQKAILISLLS
jgi:ornithine carbamoyltransferase